MVSEAAYRNLNSAEQAAAIVNELISLKRGQYGSEATQAVGRETGLGFRGIQRLVQPSRRPKAVSFEVFTRIRDLYLRLLNREVERLQAEISRLEASVDRSDIACTALVVQAEAIIRKAQALKQPNGF